MTKKTARVLLVDDQPVFRRGLRVLLELHQILIVGEANNGQEALEMVNARHPNVVLMDLQMPVLDGVQAILQIIATYPDVACIALTTFSDDKLVSQALRAGAVGYLLKDAHEEQLLRAIESGLRGEAYLPGRVAMQVLRELQQTPTSAQPENTMPESLSPREVEILRLIAQGKNNNEIRAELFIAQGTVRNHVSSILQKLGARDRTQAALIAHRSGLLGSK